MCPSIAKNAKIKKIIKRRNLTTENQRKMARKKNRMKN
jgi:hypothetical protein